ncbi:Xaa-Pro peptidase family protein [uncultured Ilyobacter sp.]|uniref:M24 family metallopeptidase n=1 Tax=uncultured Ilyobacter sp. TaxID=544433 RepID=UPI0029F568EA|nr:Xaa-Pro peptidase family protein [uncultured Ilyobacter sp.]
MAAKRKSKACPALYADRIKRVRAEMEAKKLDGYLVQDRKDQYWLTGFTGEDGYVLVTKKEVALLTDGRFDEAANIQAPWAVKVLREQRTPERTAKELKARRLKRVGFDPDHFTVADFTGTRKAARPVQLIAASGLVLGMRQCKDKGEVDAIVKAIRVSEKAFKKTAKWIKVGMTESDIAAKLAYEMQRLGAKDVSFPTIVAVGPNGALPHYETGDRKVTKNSPILIDWGAEVDWYVSDLTRMIWPGSIPRELAKVNKIVTEAHDAAIAAIKPGVTAHEIDAIARKIITKAGYGSCFNHATGHGMGLDVHEAPRVGKGTNVKLEPGMVITIEPGIYLPGKGGVRLEDDILVTETGSQVLSELPL